MPDSRGSVILASASPARRDMLSRAGLVFEVVPAEVDEERLRQQILAASSELDAGFVAGQLAKAKAEQVSRQYPSALVIGADQTLSLGERLISKAPDMPSARAILRDMRGYAHRLHAAATIAQGGYVQWQHCESATLHMRNFSQRFLEDYLGSAGERVLSSVGAYELEGLGAQLFERIDGDYFTVLGLPLLAVLGELRKRGVLQE